MQVKDLKHRFRRTPPQPPSRRHRDQPCRPDVTQQPDASVRKPVTAAVQQQSLQASVSALMIWPYRRSEISSSAQSNPALEKERRRIREPRKLALKSAKIIANDHDGADQ